VVLGQLTPELRRNIRERGQEFLDKLAKLRDELGGGLITKIQGTGLLFSCELDPSFKCFGVGSTEEYMRERGIGVIHGGVNSLRFTPHFAVTSEEVDLVIEHIRHALQHGPRKSQAEAACATPPATGRRRVSRAGATAAAGAPRSPAGGRAAASAASRRC